MFYTFFAIAKNARRKAIKKAIGQIWGEPCLGSSWTGPRLPFFTTNEPPLLIEIKRSGFSNTSTFGYQTTSSKQNMPEPSECQGVLVFVGLSWYDVYLLILGVWVSCFYVWCVSRVRFLCGRWDDGRYFTRRQILLHWHSWLHSREADRCQGKRLRDTADVRRCSTAPSEDMSMFSNWNEWYILRHCHFAVRSVNDPRVPKNIQCGSQKWIGLQRTATKLVKTTMSSLCNGSMDQWISLRWFEALSTTSRISRLQASSNKLQSNAGTRHVNGLDPGCLCLGFWFVVICDDLTWDLVMMYDDVCPELKIAWKGGPVIAPYTPAPGGPGVPRPPPFVPGGNLPGGHCNAETIHTLL